MLKTKLLAPNISDTIARPRLDDLFEAIEDKKIVTVTAGAGYGKTTLVAQVLSRRKLDTAWYRLDAADGDFATFMAYLTAGIQKHYADFGQLTAKRLGSAQALKSERESILTVWLKEIEDIVNHDLVIVLDDFHLVADSALVTEAMTFIIDRLPANLHFVIISRSRPPLRLSRLMAARETFCIDEKDLAFDLAEVEKLFGDVFYTRLSPTQLTTLHARTEGWVSGLILFNYALKHKNMAAIETHLKTLEGGGKIISEYLEENVYAALAEKKQIFLLMTSILTWLEVDMCNRLLDISDAKQILTELEEQHLFVFAFDQTKETFHYHHLFKAFLQKKLAAKLGSAKVARLHQRAAKLWEQHGQPEEALGHFLAAGDFDQAALLLGILGRKLIKNGRIDTYLDCFNQIPDDDIDQHPWLRYTYGRALELSGKTTEAVSTHLKVQQAFLNQGITKGVRLAISRLAANYYLIGDFEKAEQKFAQLIADTPNEPRLLADSLGHLIFLSPHLGKFEQAGSHYQNAEEMLRSLPQSDLHAWIYINNGFRFCALGDIDQALKFGQLGNRICERLKLHHLQTFGYHLAAIVLYYKGHLNQSLDAAQKGIRLGEEKGFREIAHTWLLIDACFGCAAKGLISDAIAYGQKALTICRQIESRWSEAWVHHALANAHFKADDLGSAEQAARSAVDILARLSLPYDLGLMRASLASVLIEQGRLDEAEPLLAEAETILQPATLFATWTLIWSARLFWEKKATTKALEKLKKGLSFSQKFGYDHWIVAEKRWIMPLLVHLYARGKTKKYLRELFPKFGLNGINAITKLRQSPKAGIRKTAGSILDHLFHLPPLGLRIRCLGNFTVRRGDEAIPADNWTSQKAALLFKYLCYHRNEGYLVKDRLMEMLWPEADVTKSRKRLNVALTTLRKILEPELPRGKPSAYILKQADAYRLELGTGGRLDIEDFDSEIKAAEAEADSNKALAHRLKADGLYRGDLFNEDPYEDWCAVAREIYREKYLRNLKHIIEHHQKQPNRRQAIRLAERYLACDPYAEDIYLLLMTLYHTSGNRAMAAKTFETYKKRMETDLDCPVTEEAKQLYQKILE